MQILNLLMKPFRRRVKAMQADPTPKFKIVEGITGMWHYHLVFEGESVALCGNQNVMATNIPLSYWGKKADHLPESYCSDCARKRRELERVAGEEET